MSFSDYVIPVIFASVVIYALFRGTDVFASFTAGIKEGVQTVVDIFPSLFLLVTAVGMLRASGVTDFISGLIAPLTDLLGFPRECSPLLILRPFSGSGSIAIFEDILGSSGADSYAGRVASVILGSSETTFYTISVYFAATRIKRTGAALPAALCGDVAGWLLSALTVRLFLGG